MANQTHHSEIEKKEKKTSKSSKMSDDQMAAIDMGFKRLEASLNELKLEMKSEIQGIKNHIVLELATKKFVEDNYERKKMVQPLI